jgi:hypothetical protein
MNDRRLLRLRQLASGAALIGATSMLPSCETPRAAAPTDTAKPVEVAAAPADAGEAPFRTPAQLNAPRPRVTMDPQEAKEAEKAVADAGAAVEAMPPKNGVILNAPNNSQPIEPVPSKVHLNAPRRPDAGTPSK